MSESKTTSAHQNSHSQFVERINQILPRLTSPELLSNQGLGNEIGFWIFDYPAEFEIEMRDFLKEVVEPQLAKQSPPSAICKSSISVVSGPNDSCERTPST